jgi:hypothetical protein
MCGMPRGGRKRAKALQIRVTPTELAHLQRVADKLGYRSVSAYIRAKCVPRPVLADWLYLTTTAQSV